MRYAALALVTAPLLALACGRVLEDDAAIVDTDADADDDDDDDAATAEGGAAQLEASPTAADARSTEIDAGYHFPFTMTFEGALFGPNGANEPTTARRAETAIFGAWSAKVLASQTSGIARTFPPQAALFLSFYVRFGTSPGSSVIARLEDGQGGPVGEVFATLASATDTVRLQARGAGAEAPFGETATNVPYRLGLYAIKTEAGVTLRAYGATSTFGAGSELQIAGDAAKRIVLGNLSAATGLDVTFDDVSGNAGAFAPPSQ
ncbi:MAG: hypothetical protein KF850_15755 [Labilithrix sp.]|nr:hypothetical protein [Labilithrix sp.]